MPAEEKKEGKGRDISRRQFFKEAGAISAAIAAAAASSVVGPEEAEARTTFAEFFQNNYRLMTDEEKKEAIARLEERYSEEFGKKVSSLMKVYKFL